MHISNPTAKLVLIISAVLFISLLGAVALLEQYTFSNSAYDIAIHIQGIWSIANFESMFNTVRGINILGDHTWLNMFLIAPLYKVIPSPYFLLLFQTIILSLGSLALYLIAKEKELSNTIALAVAIAYLLYPSLQNTVLDDFHTEVLAITSTLFSYYFLLKRQHKAFFACIIFSLLSKEDVAIGMLFYGLYIHMRHNAKLGKIVILLSAAYFIIAMHLILPHFNGGGYFRYDAGYWFTEWRINMLNLSYYTETLLSNESITYFLKLLAPIAFIPLLEPPLLLVALPAIGINLVSKIPYLTSINFHYEYGITPFLFIATVLGTVKMEKWLRKRKRHTVWIPIVMITMALYTNSIWSNFEYRKIQNLYNSTNAQHQVVRRKAINLIPKHASLSASHFIVPHVSNRSQIYMFPNPFQRYQWGVNESYPSQEGIPKPEYILVRLSEIGGLSDLFHQIQERGDYKLIFKEDDVYILKKK
jgi:uncharacterized membrane protein